MKTEWSGKMPWWWWVAIVLGVAVWILGIFGAVHFAEKWW
jgi:hypothetical protein